MRFKGGIFITRQEQEKMAEDFHYLIALTMREMSIPKRVMDDYYGYAAEGLWKAVLNYNSDKGNFKNFAITFIRREIGKERDYILNSKRNEPNRLCDSYDDPNKNYLLQKNKEDFLEEILLPRLNFVNFLTICNSREISIIFMIMEGFSKKEIAIVHEISPARVTQIIKIIKSKYRKGEF